MSPAGAARARSARSRAARARSRARGSGGRACRSRRCRPGRCPWRSCAASTGALGAYREQGRLRVRHRAETLCGGPDGLPHAAVQRDVLLAVGADADDRACRSAASARCSAARNVVDVGGALVADAVERRGVREVEPVRRRDVLDERLALRAPRAGSGRSRRRRCRSARSRASARAAARPAGRRRRGRARRRRAAARSARALAALTPKAVETVPSIPFAPRLESTRNGVSRTGKNVSTSRTGIEEATTSVASGGSSVPSSAATRGSLSPAGPTRPGDRPRRRAVGGVPGVEPARVLALARQRAWPARRASCAGRRRRSCRPTPAGSCHAASGSKLDLQRVEPRQPRAQRLGGRQVADAQDEVGRVCGRPLGSRSSAS